MSVSSFAPGDAFIVRVVKYHINNPDRKWANSYEAVAQLGGSEDELLAFGVTLVDFEKAFHQNVVAFDSLLISTWAPDSKPYNPASFISTPLTGVGTRDPAGGDMMPLNVTMNVRRITAFGRFGHIFYRGWLGEGEVSAPAGKAMLSSRAAEQTILEGAITSSGLDEYLGLAAAGLQLSMIGKTIGSARPLVGLSIGGVSTLPMDHTWFNRTTTP